MATTIAHALFGVLCLTGLHLGSRGLRCWGLRHADLVPRVTLGTLAIAAIAGNTPDLDIVASILATGSGTALHGGPTHSFAFALVAGAAAAAAVRDPARRVGIGLVVLLATASHSAIDFATGPRPGFHPSYGSSLFWPLTSEPVYSPITIFRGVKHGNLFQLRNLYTALVELITLLPLVALSLWAYARTGDSTSRTAHDTEPSKLV